MEYATQSSTMLFYYMYYCCTFIVCLFIIVSTCDILELNIQYLGNIALHFYYSKGLVNLVL